LHDLRRYAEAELTLRKLLAGDPHNRRGHYYLASSLFYQGYPKILEGIAEAQKTIALDPDHASGYFLLAWGYFLSHKPRQALAAAQQGLRIAPEDQSGYYMSAHAYAQQFNWPQMLAAAQAGLKFSPDAADLLNLQAQALVLLYRKEEARAAVELALRSHPSDPGAHYNQGLYALLDGRPADARACFDEMRRLDPTFRGGYRWALLLPLSARNPLYRWLSTRCGGMANSLYGFLEALVTGSPHFFVPKYLLVIFSLNDKALVNLLLSLLPSGRPILSKDQLGSAAGCGFTGLLFLINAIAWIAAWILLPGAGDYLWIFCLGAALALAMIVPVAMIFVVDWTYPKQRRALALLAAVMGALAAYSWAGAFTPESGSSIVLTLFVIAWLLYPILVPIFAPDSIE
jgi:tetratricopeptide (TPR) repeat protein